MTLDEAERLASAGRRIEGRLDCSARQGVAPRAEPFFRRKIDFGNEAVTFKLGIAAEPVGVYLEWAGKLVSLDRRNVFQSPWRASARTPPTSGERPGLRAPATMSMYNDVLSFDHRRHVVNIVDASRRGNGAARQRNNSRTRNCRSHRAPCQMMRDFSGPRTASRTGQPRRRYAAPLPSAQFCKKSHPMSADQTHEYFPTLDDPALI